MFGGALDAARREVLGAVVGEILVSLVADVVDALIPADFVDSAQGRFAIDYAGGVIGGNRDDGPCPVGDGFGDSVGL